MKNKFSYLLAFIIICGLATTSCHAHYKDGGTKVLREKSFNISPGKKLVVDASSGDVQITPWDKAEVYVKIIGNQTAEEKFDFKFEVSSEEIKIKTEKNGNGSWFSNMKLRFEIKAPANFNIYAATAGGDIKLGGVKGDITLKTSGGDIWGDRFEGNFVAKTSGGDINLFCNNASIEAKTSGGDIDVEYTGINKGIDLSTSGGDIEVKLPQNFNADVDLGTSGGDVDCDITLNNVKKLSETKIIGSLNKGGNLIKAHTSGGDISVRSK